MGVANVIPGVSGGTIALLTEIYEDLINSLKSFDKKAFQLLLSFSIKDFITHTNFYFLTAIFSGSIVSVFTVASLFKYLFKNYPILIWAFFFGLIVASIIYVAKRIKNWSKATIISLLIGTIVSISISFITPATENSNLFFVFLCGIVGISGMILPGLSGSFILILMGNYKLLMVTAVTELNVKLLGVFFLGSVFGLMIFSHILAWVLKKYKDETLAILTGFIIGSLSIIWPWKNIAESLIVNGKEKVISYNSYFPDEFNTQTLLAFAFMVLGYFLVYLIENKSNNK